MRQRCHWVLIIVLFFLLFIFTGRALYADEPVNEPAKEPILVIETGMHTAPITKISVDAKYRYLVTGSPDKTVRVWELRRGVPHAQPLRVLRPPIGEDQEGRIQAVAISPDGSHVACGGWTQAGEPLFNIYIFDRASGSLIYRIRDMPGPPNNLKYSPDGKFFVATTSGPHGIKIFRTGDYTLFAEDKYYEKLASRADFDKTGRLVTSSHDGFIRLYNSNFELIEKKKAPGGNDPTQIAFTPDGSKVAVGFRDSPKIDVLSGKDLSHLFSQDIGAGNASGVCWSLAGQYLYAAKGGKFGPFFIRKWEDGGKGGWSEMPSEERFKGLKAWVQWSLTPLPDGHVLFTTNIPSFGIFSKDNRLTLYKDSETAFLGRDPDGLLVSRDSSTIKLGLERKGKSQVMFSVTGRQLDFADPGKNSSPEQLFPPISFADRLNITNWNKSRSPMINRRPLQLGPGESSFGRAVSPDGDTFVLATSNNIRCYHRNGRHKWQVRVPIARAVNVSRDGRYVIGALNDGTVRWYRMQDGQEVLALFFHVDKNRWVMWITEGYFDASPGAAGLIGYHLNQGKDKEGLFITLNNMFDVFYRPDIVQAKFRGEDIGRLIRITAQEALKNPPPKAQFTVIPSESDQKKVRVCYRITTGGGGIGEVRLFHNGKLIKSDGYYREVSRAIPVTKKIASLNSRAIYDEQRDLFKLEDALIPLASASKGDVLEECQEIDVISGDNEVSVTAFNKDNTVQSYLETISFRSRVSPEEPHLYILATGVDKYKDSGVNLRYAAKDASDFYTRIVRQAATLYKPSNIHYLLITDGNASKKDILMKINELSRQIKPTDMFIFFVASHGLLIQNQYFIVTHDFDGDISPNSLVSSNEIVEFSKQIGALNQLYIFDTCHAGGVDNIVSGLYDARMSVLAKKMGLHIYASANSVQDAIDGYQGNGLFTYTLLEGLNNNTGADTNHNKYISIIELGEYSKNSTIDISKKLNHSQTPFIINFGKDNELYRLR